MFQHLSTTLLVVCAWASPAALALPLPLPTSPPVPVAAQDLPLRYTGDGLTIVVTTFNEADLTASGTLALTGQSALPFTIELSVRADGTQAGKGRVQGDRLERRLKTSENEDGSIEVTYRAKRYTVTLQPAGGGPVQEPMPTAKAAAPPAREGTIRLRKQTFQDPKLGGMASHTMLVPRGWAVTGGPFWAPQVYFNVMPSQEIEVKSPEGVSVRIEPSFVAKDVIPLQGMGVRRPQEGQPDGGFPTLYMPMDLEGWKRMLLEKVLPDAHPKATNMRVKDAIIFEDLTKGLHQGLAQQKAMAAQSNQLNHQMGMNEFIDGWVMGFEITYTEGGQEFEEARMLAVTCSGLDSQMMGRSVTWTQLRSLAFSAPAGRLESEMPLLLTILGSLQETQPWMENRARLLASLMKISHEIAMDNIRATAKRSRIIAGAYDDINEASMAGHRSRSESSSRSQERVVSSIHETDYYSVPGSTTRVQLPSGYDHVYSNGNDEYLLTNDALFNPSVDLTDGNWTAMKSARR